MRLPIEETLGHYLAEDLLALRTQPAYPLSAMDGWAVRQGDMPGPWRIAGESAAGHSFGAYVRSGEAIRISTGAMVPDGADAVLVQEDCRREGDTLSFTGEPPRPLDRHIRKRGLDFSEGVRVLQRGARITPTRLALAIGAGHAELPVITPPRVAIIDSGDELRRAGEELREGEIPATNGPMLAAMLRWLPSPVQRLGPIADRRDALLAAFADAGDAEVVITSGGASVGDHDLVRPLLEEIGAQIDFWKVAIKPGKPIMVARRGKQLFLGLPGNPVSCFVTSFLFALPLLRAACGSMDAVPATEPARLLTDMPATRSRAEFIRAKLGRDGVEPLAVQDSGALLSLASANALIVRPSAADPVQNGSFVPIYRLCGSLDD